MSRYSNNYPFDWQGAFHALIAVLILGVLCTGIASIRIIQPGFVGVKVFLGNAKDEPLHEGFHVVVPFLTSVQKIDTRIQKVSAESFEAASKDLQSVRAAIVVNYNLKKDDVVKLYREIGVNYAEIIILPGIAEVYKATTANFTAESLITQRQIVSEQIKTMLSERLEPYGIITNQVNVVNFDFSSEFNRAIEAKVTAEQDALRAEKELEKVKFEAQQAEQKAKGEAMAVLEKAKADAEALKLKLDYATPEMIMLNAVEKWDGKLPVYLFGGQSPMPVFDIKSK
jgi:regulator of protease activity HflC (stomatin/prohibitin superfamily)